MKQCSKCGATLPDEERYCSICGAYQPVGAERLKQCSKCGATIPYDVDYCASCGASQATGVFKVAKTADMLGRGLSRTVAGGICGAFGGFCFYMILAFPAFIFDAWEVVGIFVLICAVVGAVFSAPSVKFMFLVGYWGVYGLVGGIIWFITFCCFRSVIPGRIIYIVLLFTLLPLTWIWYITKHGLVRAKPKKMGIVESTKEELKDTIKEVKRFGRR